MLEPKEAAETEIEIKKSRFIALAQRVSDAEEVRRRIKETRELHPGANHVVHAFVTSGGDIFGMSDDREPKGTAGRPVLEVVKGSGIDNLLVMVVRYFGGTKLGTGGLVKAYTEAAQAVIKVLPTRPLIESSNFRIVLSYDQYEPIKKELGPLLLEPPEEAFMEQVIVTGKIASKDVDAAAEVVREISAGRSTLEITDTDSDGPV
ncbi:IMPACT family protein [Sediminispirochaeta bajacaliforniensis]|uniref:IMPACT family protein n=1 Tax=Sediminispirochaeta bajacaliforniensis TaxID=148 RepID=UPI0003621EE4|nr:YigZ family protein [Sediminispirochaeta bajacaliforniensis]